MLLYGTVSKMKPFLKSLQAFNSNNLFYVVDENLSKFVAI